MRHLPAFLLVMAAFPGVVYAQGNNTSPLSLTIEDAVTRALASSHRVEEASARHDAAEASVASGHAASQPQVAALAGYTRTNHVTPFLVPGPVNVFRVIYPDAPNNYRTRLDVEWPIYTGGRAERLIDAARMESTATTADVEALRSDVRLDVTRAFWALVLAGEQLTVVDESLGRTRAHLEDVRHQLDAGLVPPSDVLMVEAQESRQRMLSIQARSAREVAEADLARLIGVRPGTSIQPDAVLEPVGTTTTFDSLVAQALAERSDRKALLDRLSGAELRQQAAEAGKHPTIAIAGGVDYAKPNARIFPREDIWQPTWDASVNVSWPIFDGGRARADTAEAVASRRAIQARVDELDSVVALEIRQRLAEVESSRAAISAAEDGVRAATEARRVVGDRFAAGVATSTDVVDAQLAVLQASLDRTQALASAKLADARLHRALGQ